jgi:hypothetical protein
MEYVTNSALWKSIGDREKLEPNDYYPGGPYTKIQWIKNEDEKRSKAEKQDIFLSLYIGKRLKGSFSIHNITEDTVHACAEDVLSNTDWPHSEYGIDLLFKYNESFKDKLLSFNKGSFGVNLEGTITGFRGLQVDLELISIKKGCFIVTACYGNCDTQEVLIFQQYRDEKLLKTHFGRLFVRFYYCVSPYLAKQILKSEFIKKAVRQFILRPIVFTIQKKSQQKPKSDQL